MKLAQTVADSGSPIKNMVNFRLRLVSACAIGTFIILAGCTAYLAKPILLPVIAAVIIGSTIGPLADRSHSLGVPPLLASLLIVGLFLFGFYVLVIALSDPLSAWIGRAPELQTIIKDKLGAIQQPLSALQQLVSALDSLQRGGEATKLSVDVDRSNLIGGALSVLTPAIGETVIFVGSLLLFLAGRKDMKKKLTLAFLSREARLAVLRIIADVEASLTAYLLTVSAINAALGLCTGIVMYLIGMPSALMLGLGATVLNYIPYVGPATTTLMLFIVALVTFPTLSHALLAPGLFLGLAFLEGQFITPAVLGTRLTINAFLVFLAIAFWAWLWGPLGAFLAVPLLIVAMVTARHLFPSRDVELPA